MKTTKKALALFLAVLTLFSCFTLAVSAANEIYKPVEWYETGEDNVKNWGRKRLYFMYLTVKGDWDGFEGGKKIQIYFSEEDRDFNSPDELRNAAEEGKVVHKGEVISEGYYLSENKAPNGDDYRYKSLYVLNLDLNEEGYYYLLLPEGVYSKGKYNSEVDSVFSEEAVLGSFEFNKKNTTFFNTLFCAYMDILIKFYALFGFELV